MNTEKEIRIDKGIPIPPKESVNRWRDNQTSVRAVLRKLKVGDSVNTGEFEADHKRYYFYQSASNLGISIAMRPEGKHYRIWRTK
jgi:hypothetical protein